MGPKKLNAKKSQKLETESMSSLDDVELSKPKLSAPINTPETKTPETKTLEIKTPTKNDSDTEDDVRPNDKRIYKMNTNNHNNNTQHHNNNTRHNTQYHNNTQHHKHTTLSSINFNYNQYRSLEHLKEIPTADMLRVLIVRAYDQGQNQLFETLKQTLRAMNLECNFPIVDSKYPAFKPYNKYDN